MSALGDLVLPPSALIAGRVRGTDGDPLADATVEVESANAWREASSDALGRFAFGDLPAGSYRVRGTWYGRPLEPAHEVALGEGALREGLELSLPRGLAIAGRVCDEDGRGLAGVNVHAELAEGTDPALELHESFFERTDASGAFRFDDLPGGKYWISAHPRARADPDAPFLDEYNDRVGGERLKPGSRAGSCVRALVVKVPAATLRTPLASEGTLNRDPEP